MKVQKRNRYYCDFCGKSESRKAIGGDTMSKLSVPEAAHQMGVTPMFLRMGLREEKFPFGMAVRGKGNKRWGYYINAERFQAYMEARDMRA